MAFGNKRYWRRIVVDGVAYRWRVLPEVEWDDFLHDGRLLVTVRIEESPNDFLRLLGGRHPMRTEAAPEVVITPRRVAAGIRAAVQAGWPTKTDPRFYLNLPPADKT